MTALTFNLEKTTQALSFVLQKNQVNSIIPCQVHLAFDVSGSFHSQHTDGSTQKLLNRFVPFSMLFDKNHTLDSYAFSHNCEKLDDINEQNYSNYVQKYIKKSNCYHGGTNYLPILQLLLEQTHDSINTDVIKTTEPSTSFFGKLFKRTVVKEEVKTTVVPNEDKHLVFFITDGEATDQRNAKVYLDNIMSETKDIFIVFISINNKDFDFFKVNYSNTPYSNYFNLTSKELSDLDKQSDEYLYEKIINPSLANWMNCN